MLTIVFLFFDNCYENKCISGIKACILLYFDSLPITNHEDNTSGNFEGQSPIFSPTVSLVQVICWYQFTEICYIINIPELRNWNLMQIVLSSSLSAAAAVVPFPRGVAASADPGSNSSWPTPVSADDNSTWPTPVNVDSSSSSRSAQDVGCNGRAVLHPGSSLSVRDSTYSCNREIVVKAGVRASVSCSNFGVRCSSNNKAWLLLQGHQWQSWCDSPPASPSTPADRTGICSSTTRSAGCGGQCTVREFTAAERNVFHNSSELT